MIKRKGESMSKYKKWIKPVLYITVFIFIINSLISSFGDGVYVETLKDEPFVKLDETWSVDKSENDTIVYTYKVNDDLSSSDLLYLKLYRPNFKVTLDNESIYAYNSKTAV